MLKTRHVYDVTETHVEATIDGESGTLAIYTNGPNDLLLRGSRDTLVRLRGQIGSALEGLTTDTAGPSF